MKLKIAIVGTGKVAKGSYLPYLSKVPDVELLYFNRTHEKASEAARQFGGRAFGRLDDLVAENPDAVLVLTGERDRYEAAKALLALKPRRVLFEKPLVAENGQEDVRPSDFHKGHEVLRLARDAGTETAMIFNYRFFDQIKKAKAIVSERGFGELVHFTGLVNYACWSHCIDLMHFFGGPAAEVAALASGKARTGFATAYDTVAAFRLQGGGTGTLIGTSGIDFKAPLFELTFAFEHGRFSVRDLDGDLEVIDYRTRNHELHSLYREVSRWDQYRASFAKSLEAYLASIRSGSPPPVPGIAGLLELQFEAAAKESIARRRPIALAEEFPIDKELEA